MSSKAYRCRSGSRRVPPSGQKPSLKLTPRTVEAMAEEVVAYHRLFERYFQRREQCQWSLIYLCGQLSNIERQTIEPMVLALKGPDQNAVRALQQFIGAGAWDAQTILQRHQELVAQSLGDADGVVIVDGSGFPKQGHHSAGVARQYCGHLGKVANCQEGVFLVYATHRGYTFLDGRLYLPERWFEAEARPRWPRCGIPEDLTFHTEPELALDMLEGLVQRAVIPFRWVTADEHFGQNPAFLDGVAALGKFYLAEVPCDTRVWLRTPAVERPGCGPLGRPRTKPRVALNAPRPHQVRDLAKHVPPQAWNRYLVKEGSKGPLVAKFAFLRVTTVREGLPGPRVWLVFRRRLGPHPEWKFYFSNAPTTVAQRELAQLSG